MTAAQKTTHLSEGFMLKNTSVCVNKCYEGFPQDATPAQHPLTTVLVLTF